MYYFAYGSNMSHRRLRARVPSAVKLDNASLSGHRLRFQKRGRDGSAKCDAQRTGDPAHRVLGVVFNIAPGQKFDLDRHEGVGQGYAITPVRVALADGGLIEAYTYTAILIDPALLPYQWYKAHVLYGALENRLDTDYVQGIREIASIMDPDSAREARELAIYRP
ncbi:MAG: gamma-glutamylcyclotransferase [Chromatiales bacterium]|jgi:hypothetical protein